MTLKQKSEGIYLDDSFDDVMFDSLIFDCDGVLIDITKSYDQTIITTTKYILETLAKITDSIDIDFKIIDGFKSTGGFNDEVDLTYAAILSIIAAKKLKKDQTEFIFNVIKNSDSTGIKSVENFLKKQIDISEIIGQLSYPGSHKENILYQTFDQLFYGPELYSKLFQKSSKFSDPGLIENDDVIFNDNLSEKLQKKFGKQISMVTGRGKESVRYSLKHLLEKFDLINSVFLEDESRDLAKPNPQALINSISGMNSKSCLYVGDSMEDFLMAKKSTILGYKTTFCGIIGTSKNPQEKLKLFEQNEAILVLDSIELLPKVLNLE
jgi:HAD superfamily hydrolase (TIGR01549 family)